VTASVRWEADANGTGFTAFRISAGPSVSPYVAPDWRNAATGGATTDQEISTLVALQANQTVRIQVFQTRARRSTCSGAVIQAATQKRRR
jgi:hypothetical protein